jgi:transposase
MILFGMNKTFRRWDIEQDWLLPQSLREFVPAGHVAHFIRDLVRFELDLSAIMSVYDEERGFPPYHPGMMVAVLLYAYTQGVYSSRRIARCCEERLDFMAGAEPSGLPHHQRLSQASSFGAGGSVSASSSALPGSWARTARPRSD